MFFLKRTAFILLFIFFIIINFLFPQEEIFKKYHNFPFSGGKERVFSLNNDIKNLDINSAKINIILFGDYSKVNIDYYFKNKGADLDFFFAYPVLNAFIKNLIKDNLKNELKDSILSCRYKDYAINEGKENIEFEIQNDFFKESLVYFKIGDSVVNGKIEEKPDTYFYAYSWYVSKIKIKEGEKKKISVSYIVPHYFNTIKTKSLETSGDLFSEDPDLKYLSYINNNMEYMESEKVFSFMFNTSYSKKEKIIKSVYLKITANVIDQEYLTIQPYNFRSLGRTYSWKYRNLDAELYNNLLIKISPLHSNDVVNPLCFDFITPKKQGEYGSYFELSKNNDSIIFVYMPENKEEKFNVRSINIMPDYFYKKNDLKLMNKPTAFEIELSDNINFAGSLKFTKKINPRRFARIANRKSYINIFNEKGISCKYIKIKVLETSDNQDTVKISDIQVLK